MTKLIEISIIDLRKKLGFTQNKFAKKIRITQGCVSHWECGIAKPSVECLFALNKIAEKHGYIIVI